MRRIASVQKEKRVRCRVRVRVQVCVLFPVLPLRHPSLLFTPLPPLSSPSPAFPFPFLNQHTHSTQTHPHLAFINYILVPSCIPTPPKPNQTKPNIHNQSPPVMSKIKKCIDYPSLLRRKGDRWGGRGRWG